jgi:hypothetical protein
MRIDFRRGPSAKKEDKEMRRPGRPTSQVAIFALTLLPIFTLPPVLSADLIRTVLVSPVPGDPVASGLELLTKLAGIPGPSSSNRWLLKLEPGVYDVQNTYVPMREWVDIEGSGEIQTQITSFGPGPEAGFFKPTVFGANNAELRELTVMARPNPNPGDGIQMGIYLLGTSTSIQRVTVNMDSGVNCDGISNSGGAPTITDVKVSVACAAFNYGIINWSGPSSGIPIIERVSVVARNGNENRAVAIIHQMGIAVLRDLRVEASKGDTNYGLYLDTTQASNLTVAESLIEAKSTGIKYGIYLSIGNQASLTVEHTQVKCSGALPKTGIFAGGVSQSVEVRNSIVMASPNTIAGAGTFKIGATHLNGGPVAAPATCA